MQNLNGTLLHDILVLLIEELEVRLFHNHKRMARLHMLLLVGGKLVFNIKLLLHRSNEYYYKLLYIQHVMKLLFQGCFC